MRPSFTAAAVATGTTLTQRSTAWRSAAASVSALPAHCCLSPTGPAAWERAWAHTNPARAALGLSILSLELVSFSLTQLGSRCLLCPVDNLAHSRPKA